MAPEYPYELVSIRKSSRKTQVIRSDTIADASVSVQVTYGDCAFSVADLPPPPFVEWASLEKIQSVLKTHLFKVVFTDK